MKHMRTFLSVLVLTTLLALTLATPARAFDGRSGDRIIVDSNEVINDDLYVGAQEFTLEGKVNGDVVAVAQVVTINGTINGDLISAGQALIVNGTVTGAIRMMGSVLLIGENASISKDLVSAGYSLEVRKGSAIGRDLVFAGAQIMLGGDVVRDVLAATSAFSLRGTVGGDVQAELGSTNPAEAGFPPMIFMPQSPISAPYVPVGLTVDPAARITGDLKYTQDKQLSLPAGVVGGQVRFTAFTPNVTGVKEPTFAEKVTKWMLDFLRSSVAHILVGLLLLWLFPVFVKGLSETLKTRFWPSLGWGVVSWAVFFVALLLIIFATIAGGVVFGMLNLGQITGTIVWLGILILLALVIGFVLVTTFLAEVVFGAALGKWILSMAHSSLAENRYWPMVIGLLITLLVVALLSFPTIPSFVGWWVNFAVILFGLGTLWIWSRDRLAHKPI
jgi:cytoskeletal protein CcmA (bactofilin family)